MAGRFNFNDVLLSGSADASKINENFLELQTNGITYAEAKERATQEADGTMSYIDKNKLDGIEDNAEVNNINTVNFNGTQQQIQEGVLNLNETDPTVPQWAKQSTKPSYSWTEINNKPTFVTQSVVTNFWNGTQAQYDAIANKVTGTLYLINEEAD